MVALHWIPDYYLVEEIKDFGECDGTLLSIDQVVVEGACLLHEENGESQQFEKSSVVSLPPEALNSSPDGERDCFPLKIEQVIWTMVSNQTMKLFFEMPISYQVGTYSLRHPSCSHEGRSSLPKMLKGVAKTDGFHRASNRCHVGNFRKPSVSFAVYFQMTLQMKRTKEYHGGLHEAGAMVNSRGLVTSALVFSCSGITSNSALSWNLWCDCTRKSWRSWYLYLWRGRYPVL